jgi:hypothetical protein
MILSSECMLPLSPGAAARRPARSLKQELQRVSKRNWARAHKNRKKSGEKGRSREALGLTDAVAGGACEVDWTWLSATAFRCREQPWLGLEGVTLGIHSTALKTILKGFQDRD